ncbi:protein NPAT isoform X2 [Phyllobates terribilis]|uniref:protein NPAT isoform X2 n=1 Tax=Phyllobates terribilis TaxID=111132 RepID=UPI003CCA93B1
MLLPSDVARLVLGYLQQEKLMSTCQSFVSESPNLKEYAEHHTEDGTIPGCLLSLFGKNLTTILNEYITMKAKENQAEVPFMMSSLWKKLDLTLSQIRSMQESAAFNSHQRARTRKGINDRLRQRMLTSPLAVSGSLNPHPAIQQTSTPIMATQYVLRPLHTPGALQLNASSSYLAETSAQSSNSTSISLVEAAHKKPPPAATASPVRRKQDIQRRRRAAQLNSTTAASDGDVGENGDGLQAIIDNDFPQMVIENAREKILSNKSLQEKLAENINKFLGGESAAQSSKHTEGTIAEQDASIDEILGLQGGEMHMSEEAIHDILTQTELDPDFQELYDLFACVTSKAPKVSPRDSSASNNDPKNVSEKGKKQDVVERLLDVDSGPSESTKKIDVCSKGNDGDNLAGQRNGKFSMDQTSPLPSTSQQACANEKSNSGDQSSGDSHCNVAVIITDGETSSDLSGGDVVLDTQDIEMKNTSPPKDEAAYGFHMAEDISLPSTVVADKSIIRTVNEEPEGIASTEVTITGTPPHVMQQETSKNDPIIPSETPQMDDRATKSSTPSPSNKPCNSATNPQLVVAESISPAAKPQPVQNTDFPPCPGQSSAAPETSAPCSSVPSTSQTVLDDSSIITLNFTECLPEDPEIHDAVKSINEENYATIILSPLVKSPDLTRVIPSQENAIIDLTDSPVVGEPAQLVTPSNDATVSVNALSGDCAIYSISGASNSTGENNVIQLMPATSASFAQTGNIYFNSCGPTMPPNVLMVSKSSAASQKQPSLFQTPPRPGNIYSIGQTMSPKLPQGSTIILASPVPNVLQGVVGMFPVSLVGQNSSTFTAPSHQILHVPVSKPIVPKLPLPPRAKKPEPPRPSANAGKSLSNSAADSSGLSSSFVQRLGNDTTHPDSTNAAADKEGEAHRRVLFFDGKTTAKAKLGSSSSTSSKSQKADRNDSVQNTGNVSTSRSKESKIAECTAPSVVGNPRASSTPATTKDQGTEKRPVAPSGGTLGNKENVLQVETGATQVDKRSNTQESEKNVKRPQETGRKQTSLPNLLRKTPQKVPPERVCPTSPLVKQASQLLQGMQFQSPKKSSQEDLPFPPTPGSGLEDRPLENHVDQTRTPSSKRYNEEGGTPKPMFPPATPDLPTCSPASEAGSENSVNMAAHTLMILSRASLAKSGASTPLKDNSQQVKSSKSTSKKRKRDETEGYERQSHKRDHLSLSDLQKKKKARKHRKKSSDSFPAGMDVDKFLMSLHYDE